MGNQMILVILAIILFSTTILSTYNRLFSQVEIVYDGIYRLQGQKIADSLFQRVECEILTGTGFATVFNNLGSFSETKTLDNIPYSILVNNSQCDSLGNTSNPNSNYRKLNIRIMCFPNSNDTLRIGTATNPISKVFSQSGI